MAAACAFKWTGCCMPYVTENSPTHELCSTPPMRSNGFIFARIQGGFHEIRNLICDVVVVSRLLNATLIIPEIQSTTSRKGISSEFKSFAYLYNKDQFMVALEKDVKVVKTLPKNLKGARRKEEIPVFRVPYSASSPESSSCLKQAFVKYWHVSSL